jgi:anti-anti-sigma factor
MNGEGARRRLNAMLLDVVKLLLQKDTRESFKELVALVRKKPEWKADLLTLDEKFSQSEQAKAGTLVRFIHELLLQKDWAPKRAGVAEFVIQEIADNAFLHGRSPGRQSGTVRLSATLTSYWIDCRVMDSGPGFDLAAALAGQAQGEARGLARVRALASSLVQKGPNTIEVTVQNHPARIDVALIHDIPVVNLRGRLGHDTIRLDEELADIETALAGSSRLVVDLTEAQYVSSVGLRFLMLLQRRNQAAGREAVLVARADSAVGEILKISRFDQVFRCADSRADAFALLGVEAPSGGGPEGGAGGGPR